MKNEKNVFLNGEADAWFLRNKDALLASDEVSDGTKLLLDFLKQLNVSPNEWKNKNILEIGACYGYNMKYLSEQVGAKCYGIEPSKEAVKYGREKYKNEIDLTCGTSDDLPYKEFQFDVVIMGFCMFWVDRRYLMRTVSEADRVLKEKGYLVIIDFDTKIPYKRENIHNLDAWTYKMQYIDLFLSNPQYYLVDKRNFSHNGISFSEEIQERISFNVLFKESIDSTYIRA